MCLSLIWKSCRLASKIPFLDFVVAKQIGSSKSSPSSLPLSPLLRKDAVVIHVALSSRFGSPIVLELGALAE